VEYVVEHGGEHIVQYVLESIVELYRAGNIGRVAV
jgi:hypothetical protein